MLGMLIKWPSGQPAQRSRSCRPPLEGRFGSSRERSLPIDKGKTKISEKDFTKRSDWTL